MAVLLLGISDHASLTLTFGVADQAWYLTDTQFVASLAPELQGYFEYSQGLVGSAATLWVASKAVVRSVAKWLGCRGERTRAAQITALEAQVFDLKRQHLAVVP
ncbi:hypothetical protein NDU88_003389 [Pleurodeles waltl]|uniref:Uncharacterized protein n=1 Tax=Pleurodeles waltl TaxID=8319 RepID=A0AAV7M506_PLEWA|nr:hypothetical protein NDU88_003389 [Pleurodeles waltl]